VVFSLVYSSVPLAAACGGLVAFYDWPPKMTAADQKTPPAWLSRWLPSRRQESRKRHGAAPKLTAIEQIVAQTGREDAKK